jgi:hypothetical protein
MTTSKDPALSRRRALILIKTVHTAAWALFAGCILALPVMGWQHRFAWAARLAALVLAECLLLAVNRGRCPLTDAAARYTADRSPAFDIYLPEWLAKWNKVIFGSLFVVNGLFALWTYLR